MQNDRMSASRNYPSKVYIAPMEGHWEGEGRGGEGRGGESSQKPHILKESVRLDLNFQGEGGVQTDNPSVGGVEIVQEQHNLL